MKGLNNVFLNYFIFQTVINSIQNQTDQGMGKVESYLKMR